MAYDWVQSIGGTNLEQGYSISSDTLGNVCVTGIFAGTIDFDPGVDTSNLVPIGPSDILF